MRVVPPGDTYSSSGMRGAWRLAVRVPHQAVWKCVSPGDLGAVPGDIAEAELCKELATPIATKCYMNSDEAEQQVDSTKYKALIGSLLYLIASKPDI